MKRMRWWTIAVVAVLVALTGCSTPGGNVAATVNGVPISVAQVEGPVQAIGVTDGQLAEPNATVLSYAIRGEIARTLAGQQNIQLTGAPRSAVLAANAGLAKYEQDAGAASFVTDVVDSTIVLNKIGESAFLAAVQQASVQVNPRFGSWSVESASVNQAGGQLSQPWATASPTPPA
jgi:hypothetical protein